MATRAFVAHLDAALVLVGPDPPISGDEFDLVGEVASEAGELFVVLNKVDQAHERGAGSGRSAGRRHARPYIEIDPFLNVVRPRMALTSTAWPCRASERASASTSAVRPGSSRSSPRPPSPSAAT